MSANGRPDVAAFRELERHVRHLGDELAFFRRRALESERRARELGDALQAATRPASPTPEQGDLLASMAERTPEGRIAELERENGELRAEVARVTAEHADARARLAEATDRTRQLMERVRFLRQQQEAAGER